ncbi:phosphatidylinositol-specific phospholipase C domain-containing protein [Aureivirga marina]|uniref:phosphatidylinositol-specific phospholipase C domain-containing protein n=1 Tax=Aureivirga marina TaxID=1182451 RepID=UPI0018CA21A8|nr:phosphatidylinositol-specific phospholipase C domain-containing protein [Aureivirga marina]
MKKTALLIIILSFLFVGCNKDVYEKDVATNAKISQNENLGRFKSLGAAPDVKNVQFGYGNEFDGNSSRTTVAVNNQGNIVEVHQSRTTRSVWYHTGKLDEVMNINWSESKKFDDGLAPSVAMNDNNVVVEVHETSNIFTSDLWYHVGVHNGNSVSWSQSHKYDKGVHPSIAINNQNQVVEIHKSEGNSGLFSRVGTVNPSNGTISWKNNSKFDTGHNPKIALNNNGVVVEVHNSETSGKLWYHVGRINGDRIDWGSSYEYQSGSMPDIALLDDGTVIETHTSEGVKNNLWSMIGKVEGNQINWITSSSYFDKGKHTSISATNEFAVQVHESEDPLGGIWYSASKFIDRANWMKNTMGVIAAKNLGEIAIPGSHDAGMYDFSLGQTQDQNIYQQLHHGSRFFDLRLDGNLNIYHGPVGGPSVDHVLSDVRKFMEEGREELVILKFSHFKDINEDKYKTLITKIQESLGNYLYENTTGRRLGDITIGEFVGEGGRILVLVDENFPVDFPFENIYTFRDWSKDDLQNADLVMFDEYSNTTSFDNMRNDQINKLRSFTGIAGDGTEVDMFLLSWTLTPVTGVELYAPNANKRLSFEAKNFEKIPNILYVDFMEGARAVDVAIYLNQHF